MPNLNNKFEIDIELDSTRFFWPLLTLNLIIEIKLDFVISFKLIVINHRYNKLLIKI